MTKSIGRWTAILVLAAAVMPLSASAQEPAKKPAAAAPAKPAAPARPAPAARAPAFHAPAARIAPSRPAPQRAAVPHVAPQRAALPPRLAPRTAAPATQSRVQRAAPLNKPAAQVTQPLSAAQKPLSAAQQRQQLRQQRVQQRLQTQPSAKSNIQAQPNAAVQSNALTKRTLRRNGTALVTPLAARQGRFAARFAARAQAANANVRPARVAARRAWQRGLRAAFVPWIGPVFWPYAYSDVFDYAFWPDGYDDGYWAYAYDDFFDGVFWGEAGPPEDYAYAAPTAQPSTRPSYAAVQQLCTQPGSGITAWPIADIEKKVGLNDEQKQLLGEVRKAGSDAAASFKASCPPETAFPLTPPGRLAAMTARLDATLGAVQTVRPTLEKFYDSLSDEQKERFNTIGPKPPKDNAPASQAATPDAQSCKEQKPGLTNLPIERVEDAVKPTDAQQEQLKQLEEATNKAVSIMQAACPEDTPITPPGRLEAMEKRLQAMIEAANTVKPALVSFYGSLSSEQKARFNRIGRELAQSGG